MEKEQTVSQSRFYLILRKCGDLIRCHAAPFCLFILMPLIIGLYLGLNTIDVEHKKFIDQQISDLETFNQQLNCEFDTSVFLKKVAVGAWAKFHTADAEEFLIYYKSLQRFLPVDFDLYTFDEKGTLVSPDGVQLKSRYMASRLWEILIANPGEQMQKFKRIRRSVKSFLGDDFRIAHLIRSRDSCLPLIFKHRKGYIYWKNDANKPGSGMIMIFWDTPDESFRLRQILSRKSFNRLPGFFTLDGSDYYFSRSADIGNDQAEKIYARVALMGQRNFSVDDSRISWSGNRLDNAWFFSGVEINNDYFIKMQRHLLFLFSGLAISGFLAYWWASSNAFLFISIRIKLLVLFLAAVTSPIMGFVYMGYRYLNDREQNLKTAVTSESRQILFRLDESLKNAGESFNDEFANISSALISMDDNFRDMVKDKIEANDLISIELRDAENAEIMFFDQNDLFFEGMREISETFSRFCIDRMLGSKLVDAVDPMVKSITESPEAGLAFFFNRPREVHRMEFGAVPFFFFWEIIEASDGKKLYSYTVRSAVVLLQAFIKKVLGRASETQAHKPFILAASNHKTGEWFPAKIKNSRDLKDFTSRAYYFDKPLEAVLNIDNEEFLVTGQKSKVAADYALYTFYPVKIIRQDISRQRRIIASAILLFIVVAFMLGWLLSDTFIQPVSRLTDGVSAIKSRNHSFRIEQQQHDEFGDLAMSFNHMIADLKEMQLAKDVQESLLPSAPPEIPGYEVSFANRMANAVGGDYFEVTRIDCENFCVIVGDVTGHGVSSALVMAMAKALFYQGLKEQKDLVTLFSDVNMTIYEYFHKPPVRKMITVFACVINIATGKGEFVNAGHNYPVKITDEGLCSDLASVHLPIGALKKIKKLAASSFNINQRETIVFYTDGLVEVASSRKEQYGYERFKSTLSENIGLEVNELSQKLLEEYDKWLAGAEPDDDITLVVLRRL